MENVRIRAPQSCSQQDGLLPFFSLPLPLLLPVCVFLRSPLDLAALAINWFSHLASAFWRMTATACPLCLLKIRNRIRQPDPTTARERSARPLAYAEKEKVFFYTALLEELQIEQGFGDNMLHQCSVISAHLQPAHANSAEMRLKRSSARMASMQKRDRW